MKIIKRDILGADTSILKNKKLFLFDMDGTIYNENTLFPGTLELMNQIHQIGGEYVFITNNSSKSVLTYIEKLTNMHIPVTKENFFTSTQASILYLQKNYPGQKIYCQGTKAFFDELKSAGLTITDEVDQTAGIVLVGFDTELTSEKIRKTCEMLQGDVKFIATNPDFACPVAFGFIPDCGSICQMLENATHKKPLYLGKPNPTMVNIVAQKFHCNKDKVCVIGDRLYTDIATGINADVTSICVLTGEATLDSIRESNIKPTFTLQNVKELYQILVD